MHKGKFTIGNFSSDEDYPAIPLDPKVFLEKENFEVHWVEIEFQDAAGMSSSYAGYGVPFVISRLIPMVGLTGLNDLCSQLYHRQPPRG